jgi:uncharacterized protein
MLVYRSDIAGFGRDVGTGDIEGIVLSKLRSTLGHGAAAAEVRSWRESLTQMYVVLNDAALPPDAGVGIEFRIPQTAKRIDFLVSGRDEALRDHTVVIELKQWESADPTLLDGVVQTFVGGGVRSTVHPSYQAWSYTELLSSFNEAVYGGDIALHPCAYLHNLRDRAALTNPPYDGLVERAPLFAKGDVARLRDFIGQFIRHGDRGEVLVRIDGGRIRPSKSLADGMAAMMQGKREFTMVDEQKLVYETVLDRVRHTRDGEKRVILVHGGPGTGKSVVAINLLAALTRDREMAQYVTKNAAPRAVYEGRLTGTMSKTRYSNLFRGSGAFHTAERGSFRALLVDEAHRLNERSGLYQNLGENQVAELIRAADVTVFLLDEDQRVTLADIGSREEIVSWAAREGAGVEEFHLQSQFRCNGSDGYLAWLDHVLGIRPTANTDLSSLDFDYDFRVLDSPVEVRERIEALDASGHPSRMVAGYCWDWKSKKDPEAWDVVIDEHAFRMRWNLTAHGSGWLAHPDSIREVGCIHTVQGLELSYVGVIIGDDLRVRDGQLVTVPEARSRQDRSVWGWRKFLRENPAEGPETLRRIILNTYRTLMTRGLKGCYVYATDPGVREWLRQGMFAPPTRM